MRNRILFVLAAAGMAFALYNAYLNGQQSKSQPPVFNPAPNPYPNGIYATGIIESDQPHGKNVNIYPEVAGPVVQILASEGDHVDQGAPLLQIDDSVQRATFEQFSAQARAALATLKQLKAEPRPEVLQVAEAQVVNAKAAVKTAHDSLSKLESAFTKEPGAVSQDQLDSAKNAVAAAQTNLAVFQRQRDLTAAGAWIFETENQRQQYAALSKAADAAGSLLEKYRIRAPISGVVMTIDTAVGSYVSPQGGYDTITETLMPIISMGAAQQTLAVRTYIDEILVHELPTPAEMTGTMFIRGTNIRVPLTFVRVQPYVSPKIELSNQRREQVDTRVLPVVFRFEPPPSLTLYPGQLVDVYVGRK